MKKQLFVIALALAGASAAMAQVTISEAWIRATVPQAKATGAFLQLRSTQDARLLEARSEVAAMVQIHQMVMDGQTMRMHAVSGLDLPAGKTVNLASGGYHIMLMNLKRQLKDGDRVPLTLLVQQSGQPVQQLTVSVPVKPLTYVPHAEPTP